MSVDYLTCTICGETFSDCGEYYTCSNCEDNICNYCYDNQKEKHGIIGENHESADDFGEDALNKCDSCVEDEKDKKLNDDVIHILEYLLYLHDVDKEVLTRWVSNNYNKIKKLTKQLEGK